MTLGRKFDQIGLCLIVYVEHGTQSRGEYNTSRLEARLSSSPHIERNGSSSCVCCCMQTKDGLRTPTCTADATHAQRHECAF
jgi:hypothetical protein